MRTGLVVALAVGVALGATVAVVYQERAGSRSGQAGPDVAGDARAGLVAPGGAGTGSGRETGSGEPGKTTPLLEPVPHLDGDSSGLPAQPGAEDVSPAPGTASQALPAGPLPPDVNPHDVYVDPATGIAVLQRLPDATDSGEAARNTLPPGVYPRDVEVDPRTGAATLKSLPDGGS